MTTDPPCALCHRLAADHDDARCSFGYTPPAPPLRVWTARISYRGADRLDITRKSAGPEGLPFAPSWAILRPALDARSRAFTIRNSTGGNLALADRIEAEAWERYVPAYTAEMRASYRANFERWDALLARREVTLVCYCSPLPGGELQCHRRLLAAMLVKCGAVGMGER